MVEFIPARKLEAKVTGLFAAPGDSFITEPVTRLELGYEGIPNDRHCGLLRPSTSREPWYPRGTQIRNERQITILSGDELASLATDMAIPELKAEWIGGNITLSGIPHLSLLPPRTLLMFAGGATIRVDGDNGPCAISGRSIAGHFEGRDDIEFAFPRVAKHRRGLLGWIEKTGTVALNEAVTVRVWEQWIYPG